MDSGPRVYYNQPRAMSYIHFKSAFNVNYDKVTFDGVSLTLGELKKLISEKSKLAKQIEYDLEITNADTGQVYSNESEPIVKNTRVVVKRIVKNSVVPLRPVPKKDATATAVQPTATVTQNIPVVPTPPVYQPPQQVIPEPAAVMMQAPIKQHISQPQISQTVSHSLPPSSVAPPISKTAYDSLAPLNLPSKPIMYVEEQQTVAPITVAETTKTEIDPRMDEKAKLESILFSSMKPGAGDGSSASSGGGAGGSAGAGGYNQRGGFHGSIMPGVSGGVRPWTPRMPMSMAANRPLPANYVCIICKKPGHHKSLCPEAGTLPKPEERPKFPSGIPRSCLRPAQAGDKFAMFGPEGYVIPEIVQRAAKEVKKDKPSFLDDEEEEQLKQKELADAKLASEMYKIPPELKCPFGEHIIKDAVLVPCCGHFVCCDECIRLKISNDENIECPNEKCDQEIGSLTAITPFHETRKKVSDYLQRMANQKKLAAESAKQQQNGSSSTDLLDLLFNEVEKKPPVSNNRSPQETFDKENKPSAFAGSEDGSSLEYSEMIPNVKKSTSSTGIESPLQDSKISSSAIPTSLSSSSSSPSNIKSESDSKQSTDLPPLLPTPPQTATGANGSSNGSAVIDPSKAGLVGSIPPNQQQNMARPPLPPQGSYYPMKTRPPHIRGPHPMSTSNIYPPVMPHHQYPGQFMGNRVPYQQQPQPIPTTYGQGYPPMMNPMLGPGGMMNMGGMMNAPGGIYGQPMMNHHHQAMMAAAGQNVMPGNGNMPQAPSSQSSGVHSSASTVHISIQPPPSSIMTEAEFYEYRERLRKEAEAQKAASSRSTNHRTGSSRYDRTRRSNSRSRRSYSRSYTRSRSRSRHRNSRSRSRSPRRSPKGASRSGRNYPRSGTSNKSSSNRTRRSRSRSNDRKRHQVSKSSRDMPSDNKHKSGTDRKPSRSRSRTPSKRPTPNASSSSTAVSTHDTKSSTTAQNRVRSHTPTTGIDDKSKSKKSSKEESEAKKISEKRPSSDKSEIADASVPRVTDAEKSAVDTVELQSKKRRSQERDGCEEPPPLLNGENKSEIETNEEDKKAKKKDKKEKKSSKEKKSKKHKTKKSKHKRRSHSRSVSRHRD